MLAAVEAVTSTSQWQLPLFNAWGVGWWGEVLGRHSWARQLCHMYICQIRTAILWVTRQLQNPLIPREPVCVHVCASRQAEECEHLNSAEQPDKGKRENIKREHTPKQSKRAPKKKKRASNRKVESRLKV